MKENVFTCRTSVLSWVICIIVPRTPYNWWVNVLEKSQFNYNCRSTNYVLQCKTRLRSEWLIVTYSQLQCAWQNHHDVCVYMARMVLGFAFLLVLSWYFTSPLMLLLYPGLHVWTKQSNNRNYFTPEISEHVQGKTYSIVQELQMSKNHWTNTGQIHHR